MLFQAVMKILSRLVEFKILINMGLVHWSVKGKIVLVSVIPYILDHIHSLCKFALVILILTVADLQIS